MVTISEFTVDEDFSDAELVVDSLGDPNGPRTEVLANRAGTKIGDMWPMAARAGTECGRSGFVFWEVFKPWRLEDRSNGEVLTVAGSERSSA